MAEISGDLSADPLSKITLNKYIVLMRNNVVRAKVHTIHKLTRTINTLRKKWGDEEKKKVYNAKADKLGEEILIIKNMNKDNFSKDCLANKEDLNKILADTTAPLSKKAWARVALHKNIVDAVDTFHSLYPDWETAVPRILNFTKKDKRRLLRREKKKMDRLNASKSSEIQTSNGNVFKVEPICEVNEPEQIIEEKKKRIKKSDDTKTIKNNGEDPDSEEENLCSSDNVSAEEAESESESESEGEHVYNPENMSSSSGEEPESDIKHVDPFFITKDNKDYLSYVPTEMDRVTSENEAGDENNKQTSENNSGSSKRTDGNRKMGWSGRGNLRGSKVGNSGRGDWRGKMGNSGRGTGRGGKMGNSGHGNWRGGKMGNSGRGNWRGGKVGNSGPDNGRGGSMGNSGHGDWRGGKMGNFGRGRGRGGYKNDGKVTKPNNVTNTKDTTNIKEKVRESTVHEKEVKLHPSWEAKKKHSSIASFEGKKIKFDD